MARSKWIERLTETEEGRRGLERERLWIEATEAICETMAAQNVTRAELARRLGVTASNVTQLLAGDNNFTLSTLSDVFFALGRSVQLTHRPLEFVHAIDERATYWVQVPTSEYAPAAASQSASEWADAEGCSSVILAA